MDVFIEQMVTRQSGGKELFFRILSAVLCAGICVLSVIHFLPFAIFIWGAAIFGVYKVFSISQLEYEYIFTNGELDVDKITAKSTRKRLVTINAREIELLAKTSNPNFKREFSGNFITKIFAGTGAKDDSEYFCIFNNKGRCRLVFNPSEKVLNEFAKYSSKKVHI